MNNDMVIYVDVSYRGEDSKSQTGVVITIRRQSIGWYSRKRDIIAQSIMEAEYITCRGGAKDGAWMR
jgi:hypothetical protein